ncbi:hypothetical protein ACJRO7_025149 [Eucalyptus globulus]|uniref:Uncharacterized protein n=1 Tax=Eucalyptus globulus TaxID=34317 RepID=A0ABD3K922_EUCGL
MGDVHQIKYNSIYSCFTTLLREQCPSALWRGWATKFFGYGAQGGCRFSFYDSASVEAFTNVALCPFEAVKIWVQAQSHFSKDLIDGFPKVYASKGLSRGHSNAFLAFKFYRGLLLLWSKSSAVSMVMFSTFEHSVDFLYRVIRRKGDCSK